MQSLEEMHIIGSPEAAQAGPATPWMLMVSMASQSFDFGFQEWAAWSSGNLPWLNVHHLHRANKDLFYQTCAECGAAQALAGGTWDPEEDIMVPAAQTHTNL